MKAMLSEAAGGPETLVLRDLPDPTPGPGQARIRIKAAGVNYPDSLIIADLYQFKPERPFAPGGEIAGVVDAVGEGVTGVKPGDRVQATLLNGGYADTAIAGVDQLVKLPDTIDFDDAAALMMTYGTSWHALKDRAAIQPGETLLVLGAAGGVGLAAVELGKAVGARVIAAASSDEKVALAQARGAAEGVVYPRGPLDPAAQKAFAAALKAKLGGEGADVVYDPVGGDLAEPALRSTAWGGRYLVIGFTAGIPKIPLNLPLLKGCSVVGVFWGAHLFREPAKHAANVAELFAMHAEGRIKPHISARYPLAEAGAALAEVAERRALGKIILKP